MTSTWVPAVPQRLDGFGWIPDLPDPRDRKFTPLNKSARSRVSAPVVDLRTHMPPVYDQGDLGCCTAAATAAACVYLDIQRGEPAWDPSLLFLYYNTRAIEGSVRIDRGAQIRNSIKSAAEFGLCQSSLWPFNRQLFAAQPPPVAFGTATTRQAMTYQRLDVCLGEQLACLESGLPFVFGASIFENFEELSDGVVPAPNGAIIGGHAMLAVGYDKEKQLFLVRNSWGPRWGLGGYCYLSFNYLTDPGLVSDLWAIQDLER